MNLSQLTYFVRICEVQSLSKAASIVRIAQPALSRQVKALERELGAVLLARHPWGVSPTPAGEALLEQARVILRQVDNARDAVSAIEREPAGSIAVGAPSSIAAALFPRLLSVLRAHYPRLRPQLIDELSGALHQRMLRGELDLTILHAGPPVGSFVSAPLLTERVGLVARPDLTARLAQPGLDELSRLPMLVSTGPNRSRLTLETLLKGRQIDIVAEVDCMPAMLQMLADGHGYALLPYSAVRAGIGSGALDFVQLDHVELERNLELARPTDRPPNLSTTTVERVIRELVHEMQAEMRWTYTGAA